jgi:hypothetical protein
MDTERTKYLRNKYFELKEVTKDISIEDVKKISMLYLLFACLRLILKNLRD